MSKFKSTIKGIWKDLTKPKMIFKPKIILNVQNVQNINKTKKKRRKRK